MLNNPTIFSNSFGDNKEVKNSVVKLPTVGQWDKTRQPLVQ